jgi:uncharacterized protein (DUF3084 family)
MDDPTRVQEEIVRLEKEAKTRSDRIETERGMQLDTKLEAAQGSLYQLEEANKALVLKTDELHRAQVRRFRGQVRATERHTTTDAVEISQKTRHRHASARHHYVCTLMF